MSPPCLTPSISSSRCTSSSQPASGWHWLASPPSNGELTALAEALLNRLRDARDAKRWTQAELAARVGVSRKTVNTVENRVFTPSATLAIKLAEALELSVEQLFWIER